MHNESTIFRLLGALLFYTPSSKIVQETTANFSTLDDTVFSHLSVLAQQTSLDELDADFFQLLQGSGDMPSPPWGSAYLDQENALFGTSTLEVRRFMQDKGLSCDTGMREPEDHVGLLMMLVSLLLEQQDIAAANQLVAEHLMPFAPIMLGLMKTHAATDFYAQLAQISLEWLNSYCQEQQITITERRNYWQENK